MAGLRVAVVGAGLSGLTLATWLSRSGAECTVYERAECLNELGAGIQLAPNAVRLLRRTDLGPGLEAVAVRPAALDIRRWRDGEVVARTQLGAHCEALYGAPYYTVHRADLHRLLVWRALRPDGATIRLGRRCVGVEDRGHEVRLRFADGTWATADLVVGADGIHSVVRAALVTDEARYSGTTVYRGLVPAERLPRPDREPRIRVWLGPRQHCVWYPVSGGRAYSFVAAVAGQEWSDESWHAPGRVADLVAAYRGWHPEVTTLLGAADRVTRWALHDRAPLARWSAGRITVVGDAAHPMLPFGAQGANQAIESAVSLAQCLTRMPGGDLEAALRTYQEIRTARLAQVAAAVRRNVRDHHLVDGRRQQHRDRAMGFRTNLRHQAWLYGYDAETAITEALAEPAAYVS